MKNTEKINDVNEERLLKGEKEKIFDRRFYDIKGQLKHVKILRFGFYVFSAMFILFLYLSSAYRANLGFNDLLNTDIQTELIISIYKYLEYNFNQFLDTNSLKSLDIYLYYISAISSIISIVATILLYKKVYKNSKIQSAISSVGLGQQFYLKKIDEKNSIITFKLFKGEILNFEVFNDTSNNLKQLLGFEVIQPERKGTDLILLKYSASFPSVEELQDLQVKDFLKKDKIFLGIGVPSFDSTKTAKELIYGKYEAKYINFSDLPQGIGNFGGSGFGKSNTLNQLFQSFFINFDKIQAFIFVDFKQGIESEPYRQLELKKKTGRIFTLEDNRLQLLNLLEKMLIIAKSRGLYIKSKGLKKIINKNIILFFDEMAEVLDYNPIDKEEKEIQKRIIANIETLLRIGRAAGVKIGYSTQSAVQNASGLTSGMKNNTPLKFTHGLASNTQISSVYEDFEAFNINPLEYDIGKCAIVNLTNSQFEEVRSLFIPDDFSNKIKFAEYKRDKFDEDIKEYYKKYINGVDDKTFYFDKTELLNDLLNEQIVKTEVIPVKKTQVKEEPKPEEKPILKLEKELEQPKQNENNIDNFLSEFLDT